MASGNHYTCSASLPAVTFHTDFFIYRGKSPLGSGGCFSILPTQSVRFVFTNLTRQPMKTRHPGTKTWGQDRLQSALYGLQNLCAPPCPSGIQTAPPTLDPYNLFLRVWPLTEHVWVSPKTWRPRWIFLSLMVRLAISHLTSAHAPFDMDTWIAQTFLAQTLSCHEIWLKPLLHHVFLCAHISLSCSGLNHIVKHVYKVLPNAALMKSAQPRAHSYTGRALLQRSPD